MRKMYIRHLIRIAFILLTAGSLFSQTVSQDSIARLLNEADDSTKMEILRKNARLLVYDDPGKAKNFAMQLRDLAKTDTTQHHKLNLGQSYSILGQMEKNLGNMSEALAYQIKAVRIYEEINHERSLASAYNDIGIIHKTLKQYRQAYQHYLKSHEFCKKINSDMGFIMTANNIGTVLIELDSIQKAEQYYQRALKRSDSLNILSGKAIALNNLGELFSLQKKNEKALKYYLRTLEIDSITGDEFGRCYTLLNIASAYTDMGQFEKAGPYLSKAFKIANNTKSKQLLSKVYRVYSRFYEEQGQFEEALRMYDKFHQYNDSVINERTNEQIAEMETRYETEKKEKENIALKHKAEVEEKKKEKQRLISLTASGGALLILVFAGFIYHRLKITREQKGIIEEKNQELNQTNEEIMAQRDQIESQKNIIEEKHTEIQHSINYARRIQTAILPPQSMIDKYLPESFVLYMPKDVVAGDFYWLEHINKRTYFAVADCTGHGVPGAMVSVVCHGALNRCVREYKLTRPSDILDKTREIVLSTFEKSEEQVKDGMDIALISFDPKQNKLEFSGANNPVYIIRSGSKEPEIIRGDKQSIGYSSNPKPFINHETVVYPGDRIYLFTDGYADQFGGPKNKKLGYKHFREILSEGSSQPLSEQKQHLQQTITQWAAAEPQIDDICVAGIMIEE